VFFNIQIVTRLCQCRIRRYAYLATKTMSVDYVTCRLPSHFRFLWNLQRVSGAMRIWRPKLKIFPFFFNKKTPEFYFIYGGFIFHSAICGLLSKKSDKRFFLLTIFRRNNSLFYCSHNSFGSIINSEFLKDAI
jgi:hypothetical protein